MIGHRLLGALVTLVVLTALVSPLAGQATIRDIATDQTDSFDLADAEPSIAVNPRNPLEIVIVTFSENWGPGVRAPIWLSTDGGVTWTKRYIVPEPGTGLAGPKDQKVAFDSLGNVFLAELGTIFAAQDFVMRQNGTLTNPLNVGASYGDDQPHLDVGRAPGSCTDVVFSPWLDFGPARSTVSFSNNAGIAMTNVGAGDNSAFPNRTTRIALAPDGRAYIIYKTREGSAGARFENVHFRVARSDDCGATWTGLGATGVSVHGVGPVESFFTTEFGNLAKGKVARAEQRCVDRRGPRRWRSLCGFRQPRFGIVCADLRRALDGPRRHLVA